MFDAKRDLLRNFGVEVNKDLEVKDLNTGEVLENTSKNEEFIKVVNSNEDVITIRKEDSSTWDELCVGIEKKNNLSDGLVLKINFTPNMLTITKKKNKEDKTMVDRLSVIYHKEKEGIFGNTPAKYFEVVAESDGKVDEKDYVNAFYLAKTDTDIFANKAYITSFASGKNIDKFDIKNIDKFSTDVVDFFNTFDFVRSDKDLEDALTKTALCIRYIVSKPEVQSMLSELINK